MDGFRPPTYGPGQSEALMEDPMSLMLMMMGMPMLQQAMGQQNFIPHFTPSQALSDQFLASRYQRNQFKSLNNASELGNAAVASRLLGLRAMVTDAPASQLNKEQAAQMASVINNPISKALMASAFGPDTVEAALFGRKGDPAALANATNRISYFRKDSLGQGKRMSGDSMADFAANVHQNLYGTGADIDAMHGFMAGQTGQLVENLFQRGQLPQSLGELSPAQRVKALSAAQRDDATMNRLAEQFGHTEMLKDEKYAGATREEQRKMLAARTPDFRQRLDKTFSEVDKFNANDPRAKSAGEIEQMEGYGTAARNVDAQRVSEVAKKYTGAIDAVREIFGDNGAGDAPMGQLIEALDALSAGSIDRLDPAKVEKTMREMRIAAKDTGMGLQAMGQLGARGESLAQLYGTPQQLQLQANLQTMQTAAGMRDAGMFSRKRFGDMNQAEATQEAQNRIYRGQASEAGKSMAALNRMFQENPDLYKGTRLEAAMKAYNDPKSGGKYTFEGKEYDLAAEMARNGRGSATAIVEQSGGDSQTFKAFYNDKGTQEYQQSGMELIAQRKELTKHLAQGVINGALIGRMSGEKFDALRRRGQSEKEFERERNQTARALSFGFADVLMNETGGMTQKERAAHLEKRHKEVMAEYFVSQGATEKEARRRADAMSSAMFGDTEARRRERFSAMAAQSNAYVTARTNQQLSANDQLYSQDVEQRARNNATEYADTAEANKKISMGRQSSLIQRSGEVLEKMGKDPNYSGKQAAHDLLNVVPIEAFRDIDPEAAAEADKLKTVGAAGESGLAVQEATAFNQLDRPLLPPGAKLDGVDASGPRVGGGISSVMPVVQTGMAAAALYGNASAASAAIAGDQQINAGQTTFQIVQGVGDVLDNGAAAAGVASKLAQRAGVLAKPAAAAGKFSSALGAFGKVNAFLSPLLGGIAGAFEGAANGRGALEGGILGALTGDAETGSIFSSPLGIEKGSTTDKVMGVGGATAVGAMTGAAIGSVVPVLGTAVGAGLGAAVGFSAELYKWATEPSKNVAQSSAVEAVQQTVNATQNAAPAQSMSGGGGNQITVNGTLALRGMQEAVLQATGERPMETPGGGAPVFATGGA